LQLSQLKRLLDSRGIHVSSHSVSVYYRRHRAQYGWPTHMSRGESSRATHARNQAGFDRKVKLQRMSGKKIQDVADDLGVSHGTVERASKRLQRRFLPHIRVVDIGDQERHREVVRRHEAGEPPKAIARAVGYSAVHVRRIIRKKQ